MKFQFRVISWVIMILALSLAACSGGAPATNPPPATSAPAGNAPATVDSTQGGTSAPATVNATNSGGNAPTRAPSTATTAAASQATATSAPATVAPTTAASNAPASGTGALDLIASAMRAQASSKSFRSTVVTTPDGGKSTTTIIEYVAPDRIHMVRPTGETIVIKGQGTWEKVGGKWMKSPVDMSSTVFAFLDPSSIEQLKSSVSLGTVQLVGPALLGTTPTIVYKYDETLKGMAMDGSDLHGSYQIWVGATDQRVYKLEGDSDSPIKPGAKMHSLNTYEYDINIQIQPPI